MLRSYLPMSESPLVERTSDILGVGALNMDYWYRVSRIEHDEEQVIEEEGKSPGGSSANTMYALGKLGLRIGFLGVVGNDRDGGALLRDFKRVGVEIKGISRRVGRTGYTLCIVDSLARRSILIHPGVNDTMTDSDVDWSWLRNTRAIHLSSFVGEDQLHLQVRIVQAVADGVMVTFAPGILYARRGLSTLQHILARADILFLNRDELLHLGGSEFGPAVQALHRAGCRKVVVTLGGSDPTGKLWFASDGKDTAWGTKRIMTRLPIVDSTGAGDAFAAGFLLGVFSEQPLRRCGTMGQIMAEFCLSQSGARSGLPSLQRFQAGLTSTKNK